MVPHSKVFGAQFLKGTQFLQHCSHIHLSLVNHLVLFTDLGLLLNVIG
jgi:hypothetical protein